jgi:hypothetical protein
VEYMLLINLEGEPGSASPEQAEAMSAEFAEYSQSLIAAGAMVAGDQLHPPTTATTVRVSGGETLTSDGPFAETKEWLGGYYKIDVDSLDDAIEWAGRIPSVKYGGSIEVRPVVPMTAGQPSSR